WQPARGDSGNFFGGQLRDIRIYSRALPPSEISAIAAGPTFHSWKSERDLPSETAPTSDLDGDGLPALLEYATGTAPDFPGPLPRYEVRREGGRLKLYFRYQPENSDLAWHVEASNSLDGNWKTIAERAGRDSGWTLAPGTELVEKDGFVIVADPENPTGPKIGRASSRERAYIAVVAGAR